MMEKKYLLTQLDKQTGQLETYDIRTGDLVSKGGVPVGKTRMIYSDEIAQAIYSLVLEGHSFTKISQMDGMPSMTTIATWRSVYPEFNKRLKAARKYRADLYRDKAEDVLDAAADKDDVPLAKFKFDSYMKLAEKDNAEEYGQASTASGNGLALQMIINTGIVRDDEHVMEVEHESKEDDGGVPGDGRGHGGEPGLQADDGSDRAPEEESSGGDSEEESGREEISVGGKWVRPKDDDGDEEIA